MALSGLRKRIGPPRVVPEDDDHILDEQEQEDLIRQLAEQNANSTRHFRVILLLVSGSLAVFFGFAAVSQYRQPWRLLQGLFSTTLSASSVTVVLALTSLAMAGDTAFMVASLTNPTRTRLLRYLTLSMSLVPLLFWCFAFFRIRHLPVHLFLLSFAPPLVSGACWYIEHAAAAVDGGISQLRQMKYEYKRA